MSDSSRPRVTITLGHSGQVVKRDVSGVDSLPLVGTKRSVRDRLGSDADNSLLHGRKFDNKRLRQDVSTSSVSSNGLGDIRLRKDDLRYKLLQKDVSRRAHRNDSSKVLDLRDKLSKAVPPPVRSLGARHQMAEPKEPSSLGQMPPPRSADNLHRMDSYRSSYPTWTLDQLRRRSPDGHMGASRNLSPQRSMRDLSRNPPRRTVDDVRPLQYMGSGVLDPSRTSSSSTYLTKSMLPSASAKPLAPPLSQLPPQSVQKSSYLGDEQQTVDGLLNSMGLGKYAINFKAEEIDMTILRQMGETDLKDLGIPMGPRKKILLALLPRSRRQP